MASMDVEAKTRGSTQRRKHSCWMARHKRQRRQVEVEEYADTDTNRQDLPVYALGTAGSEVVRAVEASVLPELALRFGLERELLLIQDLFVAKYSVEKGGLSALEPHVDGSDFSFVLALNKRSEYVGGGTQFLELDGCPTFRPKRGYATLFCGKNKHRGLAISAGVRYVLAGFLRCGEETDDDDPFSVYNCSPYGESAADHRRKIGGDCAGTAAERSVPVLSMKAKLEMSGERYNSESNWDKLVVEERVHEYQHRCLYGRKVDGRPEVVKIAPPEGLRGFVVLTREKFDGYAAMVR